MVWMKGKVKGRTVCKDPSRVCLPVAKGAKHGFGHDFKLSWDGGRMSRTGLSERFQCIKKDFAACPRIRLPI